MAELVLVNPCNDFASFKTFEVLGLGYLASYVEAAGIPVSIYDCNFEDPRPDAVADYCRQKDALAVGFTSMVGTLRRTFQAAQAVRRTLPDVPTICGGYAATFENDLILHDCSAIDFVQRGEGELSLLNWLQTVHTEEREGCGYNAIPGLVLREAGGIRQVPGPVLVERLDDIPFPRRSPYLDRIGLASILSSRGCSATCTFCSIHQFYRISSNGAIRCRTPKNVADEIEQIHRQWGITRFLFIDDNFFMSERFMPGRLPQIALELVGRGLTELSFEVSSRAADLRLPELEALIDAGLNRVYVGIESGSAAQLKRYRKGTPDRNVWAVQELRARKVEIDFGFIPFDPYLQPGDLLDSLNFLLEQDLIEPGTLNTLTVSTNLFPGTPLHDEAKADGLLHQTEDYYYWFDFQDREMAPVYERIIEFFKTSYVISVVGEYSNGIRQKEFWGPDVEVVTASLRRLYRLWIRHVEALLRRRDTEEVDREIERVEAFITNTLTAHILLNRADRAPELTPAQRRGIEAVREDATALAGLMERQEDVPPPWDELFTVERHYRVRRAEELRDYNSAEATIWLQPHEIIDVPCLDGREADLIDVFVPPDIDLVPAGSVRPAQMPPSTLYLGSAHGMPPIECHVLSASGDLLQVHRLFKGWTEIVAPPNGRVATLRLCSHVHLFRPVTVMSWGRAAVGV